MTPRDSLAAMVDPHAFDRSAWTAGSAVAQLARIERARRNADLIMTKWELKK